MSSSSSSLVVSVGAQNHPGRTRTENQDRISRAATPFGELFILADGVGGYGGGGEAAEAVVDGLTAYLNAHGDLPVSQALQEAARAISADLSSRQQPSGASNGMSSTVVLALIKDGHATIAHAGDSRAYLVRDNRLSLLTRDDSVVERMVSRGVLTQAQAREHPDANVLTKAIGQRAEVALNITDVALKPGDALMLCSDGLWAYADHPDMEAIAGAPNLSAEAAADALLNLALQEGGGDNISLQFLRFDSAPTFAPPPTRWLGLRPWVVIPVAIAAGALIFAFADLTRWNRNHPLSVPHPGLQIPGLDTVAGGPPPATVTAPRTAAAQTPQASAKTPVVLVLAGDSLRPIWTFKVKTLTGVDFHEQKGNDACLALRLDHGVLAHSPAAASVAQSIAEQARIKSSDTIELASDKIVLCGGSGVIILPQRPGAIRTGIEGAAHEVEEQIKGGITPPKN